ncbi:MAG: hypothetical protein IIA89_12545 [Chloroflexi bacterium]|nr:hypothetical protein [Chloroflexota bacterium]
MTGDALTIISIMISVFSFIISLALIPRITGRNPAELTDAQQRWRIAAKDIPDNILGLEPKELQTKGTAALLEAITEAANGVSALNGLAKIVTASVFAMFATIVFYTALRIGQ